MMTLLLRATINTWPIYILWLFIVSSGMADNVLPDKAEVAQSAVSFQVFSESEQDKHLIEILEENDTYNRISKIINHNFILDKPVRLHIQHPKKSLLIQTELSEESHVVVLPFSFLHTLYQGLSTKYLHQTQTVEAIFSATVEFFIWSEFAHYLIKNNNLEIIGETYTALDNFASIMLLNQYNSSSDFIADASEAYLLIGRTGEFQINQNNQSELQRDQLRYRHIICLTMGFNELTQISSTQSDHLKDLSWSRDEVERCKQNYSFILNNWHLILTPLLREKNSMQYWPALN